jgi:pimeloyl-ACP methyl ester carboxylesterase
MGSCSPNIAQIEANLMSNVAHPLNNPYILTKVFFPVIAYSGSSIHPHAVDGRVMVERDIGVGFRFYARHVDKPVMLYFHDTAETVTNYEFIAPIYAHAGLSLLVMEYRGYGWGDSIPLVTEVLPDAEKILDALPDILAAGGIQPNVPIFVMGRSFGSASAVHLAYKYPKRFHGLIIEGGFARAISVFKEESIAIDDDYMNDPLLPFNNLEKIKHIKKPLLLIHGENDDIHPISEAQEMYDASPSLNKRIVRIRRAAHTNLLHVDRSRYFESIRQMIRENVR